MTMPLFELCIEPDDAALVEEAGADRIELCASLMEGGITPSRGAMRAARAAVRIPINAIIRPRGGDFVYTPGEFAAMRDDIALARDEGLNGVVFGCLTVDGDIDEPAMTELVALARPLPVTCHRAFDMARDPRAALEALIRSGVARVLTSGQRPRAVDGAALLRELHAQAAGRIIVLGCGELEPGTMAEVHRAVGLSEYHFAATRPQPSPMRWRNPDVGMGGTALEREYTRFVTDPDLVRATIAAARAA